MLTATTIAEISLALYALLPHHMNTCGGGGLVLDSAQLSVGTACCDFLVAYGRFQSRVQFFFFSPLFLFFVLIFQGTLTSNHALIMFGV